VSRKLVGDLKVPFVPKGNFRQDDTSLHRALREALVNTLVHADYTDRASILVVKDPAGFVFRNPGVMRVPAEQALRGGESDCRNRTLHKSQMNDDSVKGKICVMRG
jgi:predicted HTH transcriptional regulator